MNDPKLDTLTECQRFYGLKAPAGYRMLSEAERQTSTNGCGPSGGWITKYIPDHPAGFDFFSACAIHDWMYAKGRTLADKLLADETFRDNLGRVIRLAPGKSIEERLTASILADQYYFAVRNFGTEAYWTGKSGLNAFSELVEAA